MSYELINDFCAVRNLGGAHLNGKNPSPRFQWLIDYCDSNGLEYEVDVYTNKIFGDNNFYNLILKGSSDKMVVAHHDIVNPSTDNANDNSASVINALMIKKLRPSINVVILDGEEPPMMGVGSQRCSDLIKEGKFGSISWVLNLELSGKGGKYFFIGNYPGVLSNHIKGLFPGVPVVDTPFNDAVIFRRNGIDSVVINPLPPVAGNIKTPVMAADGTYLDFNMLFNCHTKKDTLSTISSSDMKEFVEEVVLKIID